jgi:hypothetical protein
MCEFLMTHFITIEAKEPKLNYHIKNTTHFLPTEILVRIINSRRINRKLCNNMDNSLYEEISHEELKHFAIHPYTVYTICEVYLLTYEIEKNYFDVPNDISRAKTGMDLPSTDAYWYIDNYIPNSPFSLIHTDIGQHESGDDIMPALFGDPIVAFSIFDYYNAFNRRKSSNAKHRIIEMLRELNNISEYEACAWLIQLAYDTRCEIKNSLISNSKVLYAILAILVDRAIAMFE